MKRSYLQRKEPMKRSRKRKAKRKVSTKGFAHPKPVKRAKAKLRAGRVPQNEEYKNWIRTQPCIGLSEWPPNSHGDYGVQGHYCQGETQPNHERNHTGWGLKEPDETCVPFCWILHTQWSDHTGRFAGWDNEARHRFMEEKRIELNARFELETGKQLEWRP